MLALACLMRHNGYCAQHRLRINMIVHRRTVEEANETLSVFLKNARIEAETRVIDSEGMPFTDVIREHSSDAVLTFMGLRAPRPDETVESYGEYVALLRSGLVNVPQPIFVMAAENVDFQRIFA